MKKEVGLWIDHRKAVMVFLDVPGGRLESLESRLEKHIHPAGGAGSRLPYGVQDVMKEDGRERRYQLHLKHFYEAVLARIRNADALFIMGPGPAKVEFRKLLQEHALEDRITGFETVDKMTDRQLSARIQDYFLKPRIF